MIGAGESADRDESAAGGAGLDGQLTPVTATKPARAGTGQGDQRVGLLVNPTAGTGRGAGVGRLAEERLRQLGHEVVVIDGDSAAAAGLAARRAVAATGPDGLDALVVVGGDGAVHLGVNAVAGQGVPLGIVPAGSGNDIARGLDLPLDPAVALDGLDSWLRSGSVRAVDGVRVGSQSHADPGTAPRSVWVAGVVAAGFDAVVNERANGWRWPRGRVKYNLAISLVFPTYRPRRYEVLLDGVPWHVDAMLLAVANTRSYGGAMRIAPDASPSDGLLDVVVVGPVPLPRFARLFPRVYAGTHTAVDVVEVRRAATVEVRLDDGRRGIVGYGDGERLAPLPLRLEAVPGALSVLAPAQGAADDSPGG